MAALEAMSCGLPWVGPPVGALADVADAAPGTGVVFTSRSADEVAGAMRALVESHDIGSGVNDSAARQVALAKYELAAQTASLVSLLSELTGR
jgi:glycosyltransferase involved in cell wall biosynthesis